MAALPGRIIAAIKQFVFHIIQTPLSAAIAGFAGVIVYLIAAFRDAHNKLSFLDEGLYLYKGLLFASGQYTPFQDFGVWSNHMPLAFLIPGQIQEWFGPGLRTGRYFSILLSLIMLIGLWLTVKVLSGKWWAAGAIWAYALNPAAVKLFTIAISQAIVASIFVWMLYFCLGKERKYWQITLAGALAGALILTRENMVPVFPILVVSIIWRFGWKCGLATGIAGLAVLFVGHAAYWPNILQIWAGWIPANWTPFLNSWRLITDGVHAGETTPDKAGFLVERSTYIWLVIRLHFVGFFGAISSLLLFPSKAEWSSDWRRKTAVFLLVLYGVLFAFHLYATFGMDYCVSCILLYTAFFNFVGIILFALTIPSIVKGFGRWRNLLIWSIIIVTITGLLFSSMEDFIKPALSGEPAGLALLGQQLLPGVIPLVQSIFNVRYYPAVRIVAAVAISIILILLVLLLVLLRKKMHLSKILQNPARGILIFMTAGFLLSPTILFGAGNNFFDCSGDVIKDYENAGKAISESIPPGSTLYWEGRSDAIFLYLTEVEIFPPQLNHVHGFYREGDEQELLRMGRYNNHLAGKWFATADFILVEKEWVKKWQIETLDSSSFIKVGPEYLLGKCEAAGKLQLYQRISP